MELCVCNPLSGEADVLPCLRGDEAPGPYACALLAVDDLRYCKEDAPPRSASSYRFVLVFDRDGFTAVRCFCSDAGRWGPEAHVTGGRPARIETTTWLHRAQGTVVHRGAVFWPRLKFALLTLPAVHNMAVVVTGLSTDDHYSTASLLLGSTPNGKLWRTDGAVSSIHVSYRELFGGDILFSVGKSTMNGEWRWLGVMRLPKVMPELSAVNLVKLWWFCEQSGIVFFTARSGGHAPDVEECCCYTLNFNTWEVDKVATSDGAVGKPWLAVHGYEMDRVSFLSSLGEKR